MLRKAVKNVLDMFFVGLVVLLLVNVGLVIFFIDSVIIQIWLIVATGALTISLLKVLRRFV